ncbi:MAG: hypothetical protein AAGN46_09395, partial [Acidobacteriota bacterium]
MATTWRIGRALTNGRPDPGRPDGGRRGARVPVVFLLGFLVFGPPSGAQGPSDRAPRAAAIELSETSLPAEGTARTEATVDRPVRVAFEARAARGVELRLVDRATGPGPWVGSGPDGLARLDRLLALGRVRLETRGRGAADDRVALRARPFRTVEAGDLPTIVDPSRFAVELLDRTLGDLEERAWWLRVERRGPVLIEAAGRALADLRLWTARRAADGTASDLWLTPHRPTSERIEPRLGEPLQLLRIDAVLEPGLYRLVASGGPPLAWADSASSGAPADAAGPLHLRLGVPTLGDVARRETEVSPFGVDRFRIGSAADFVRLTVEPRASLERPVDLEVATVREDSALAAGSLRGRIKEDMRPRRVDLFGLDAGSPRLLAVRGLAGTPYDLDVLRRHDASAPTAGRRWIELVQPGPAADALDLTALALRRHRGAASIVARRALSIAPGARLERDIDLATPAALLLEIPTPLALDVEAAGVEMVLAPFPPPPRAAEPPARREQARWSLEPGLYRLQLRGLEPGTRRVVLTAEGAGIANDDDDPSPRPSARFESLSVPSDRSLAILTGTVPDAPIGRIERALPIDLEAAPLTLGLAAGEAVEVPLRGPTFRGLLRLRTAAGERLPLSLDGAPATLDAPIAGLDERSVRLVAPSDGPVWVELSLVPLPTDEPAPETLTAPPRLGLGEALALDLPRGGSAVADLELDAAGSAPFVRLETTGLLDTRLALASPLDPELDVATTGGAGRNAGLARALGDGRYRARVAPVGRSAGRVGLRLEAASIVDGGRLEPGRPARRALEAWQALRYRFDLDATQRVRIRALSLGEAPLLRLEDADSWPMAAPTRGELDLELPAGAYALILGPEAVAARRLTQVEIVPPAAERSGHGPFALPFDAWVEHLWLEDGPDPASSAVAEIERPADRWRFALTAPATVEIGLDGLMVGALHRLETDADRATSDAAVTDVTREGWRGRLDAGAYELRVRAVRRDNRRPYRLRVTHEEWMPGTSRRVDLDAGTTRSLPLSIGEVGLVEIATFGDLDVRARLLDAQGVVVAAEDDRSGDWNPRLLARLAPGSYSIELEAAQLGGSTRLDVHTPRELAADRLRPGRAEMRSLKAGIHRVPLDVEAGDLVVLAARSTSELTLDLERATGGGPWTAAASSRGTTAWLAMPRTGGEDRWRLRLEVPEAAEVTLAVETPALVGQEPSAARGRLRSTALPALDAVLGRRLGAARLLGDGCLCADGGRSGDGRWSTDTSRPLTSGAGPRGARGSTWSVHRLDAPLRFVPWTLDGVGTARFAVAAGGRLSCAVAAPDEPSQVNPGPIGLEVEGFGGGLAVLPSLGADSDGGRHAAGAVAAAVERPAFLAVWPQVGAGARLALAVPAKATAGSRVETRGRRWSPPVERDATWGVVDGALDASAALRLRLPSGSKRLRLSLDAGLAAVALAAGTPVATLWADAGASATWTFGAEGLADGVGEIDALLLLGNARADGRWRLEALPQGGMKWRPAGQAEGSSRIAGVILDGRSSMAGRQVVPIDAGEGPLEIWGAQSAVVVGATGDGQPFVDRVAVSSAGSAVLRRRPR